MAMKYTEQVTVPITPEQFRYLHSIKRTTLAEEVRRMIDAEIRNHTEVFGIIGWKPPSP